MSVFRLFFFFSGKPPCEIIVVDWCSAVCFSVFFWDFFFFFGTARHCPALPGTARHCPALPAAMFGRHCQPPFLVRHCYLRRFNIREGGRTVATGIVTQGQCVVELWRKKKQKWRRELNPGLTITEASAPLELVSTRKSP